MSCGSPRRVCSNHWDQQWGVFPLLHREISCGFLAPRHTGIKPRELGYCFRFLESGPWL